MRKISADLVFPVTSTPLKEGVVVVSDDGKILELGERKNFDEAELEIYKGIIVPGFVNTHCHLELSHMKGLLEEHTGLITFIKGVLSKREASKEIIQDAIVNAEKEMINNGIVAVGDISNTSDTFQRKYEKKLHYHTFVEVFNLVPEASQTTFDTGLNLWKELKNKNQHVSIAPHAPYTVSPSLFYLINNFNAERNQISSMHNQETIDENLFFLDGTGGFTKFYKDWGFNIDFYKPSGKKSLPAVLPYFSSESKLLLVHNTITDADDIKMAQEKIKEVYWCFNPNANLYIENKLPDYKLFIDNYAKCTLGTDSLASNRQLSILEEMKTITDHASYIDFEVLLKWGTINGAEFLNFDHEIGSIEKNKRPGLNLIEHFNIEKVQFTKQSKTQKLI